MKITQLNHIAIHVADVERSLKFYRMALRLSSMPRPAFNFPGAWLRLGDDQELHLIGGRSQAVVSQSRGTHFALMVENIDACEAYLKQLGVAYTPRKIRPDGAYQIYLTDPDGHVMELCTPPGSAPETA